jgi:hypothetical protein
MPVLFSDLVLLALSFLDAEYGNERKELLRVCSLVCREWTSPSQSLLFRTVRVLGERGLRQFVALLHAAPHLGECVRELHIQVYKFVPHDGEPRALSSSAVDLLPNVTTLRLWGPFSSICLLGLKRVDTIAFLSLEPWTMTLDPQASFATIRGLELTIDGPMGLPELSEHGMTSLNELSLIYRNFVLNSRSSHLPSAQHAIAEFLKAHETVRVLRIVPPSNGILTPKREIRCSSLIWLVYSHMTDSVQHFSITNYGLASLSSSTLLRICRDAIVPLTV